MKAEKEAAEKKKAAERQAELAARLAGLSKTKKKKDWG